MLLLRIRRNFDRLRPSLWIYRFSCWRKGSNR